MCGATMTVVPRQRLDADRLRAAARRAADSYPGPVGALLSREILTWAEFGHRFDGNGLVDQVVREVLAS